MPATFTIPRAEYILLKKLYIVIPHLLAFVPIKDTGVLLILNTNKTIDKKSSHNPYMQDYARFFV